MLHVTATQIDKIKRKVNKYRNKEISQDTLIKFAQIVIVCLIAVLLIIYVFSSYYSSNRASEVTNEPVSINGEEGVVFSHNVIKLKNKIIAQLKAVQMDPSKTLQDKLSIPENLLFQRTKTVQFLLDYTEAATKEMYADKYSSNPDYNHVSCIASFTPGIFYTIQMDKLQSAVEKCVNKYGLYNPTMMETYAKRTIITAQNSKGMKPLVGQYGVTARKKIDKGTCIGHYFGDEYLQPEFAAQYPSNSTNMFHKKKWDYYMTIAYNSYSHRQLGLKQMNITFAIDAYHDKNKQNLEPFINDARRTLTQPRLSAIDRKRQNCEFVCCAVNGIMQTFIVTTDDIHPNEQLFIYYGPNYA